MLAEYIGPAEPVSGWITGAYYNRFVLSIYSEPTLVKMEERN